MEGFVERLPVKFGRYQSILDKLLARKPDERFNTAEQMLDALDGIGTGNDDPFGDTQQEATVVLPAASAGKTIKRGSGFNRYLLGVLLLLVVIVPVGIGYFYWDRPADPTVALEVDYSYRPADQLNFRPLVDSGALRSGDHYRIHFTPEQDGYVYIFQIDSSGAVYRLFPFEGDPTQQTANTNPVKAGITYFAPSEDQAFQLDDQVGHEQIHPLAFRDRNLDLENQYAALAEARRAQDQSRLPELQAQLIESLRNIRTGALPVLNFRHNARGTHEL
jgi:hypothetical protein